jgi:REP element-mobilizing transposase RayT
MDYLPRLPRAYYQGDAVVHWTLTVFDCQQGWLAEEFHARFRELMLHAAAREGPRCPTYCLMPDHMHLIWMGLRLDSDQINGMTFLRTYLETALAPAKFQPQPHDHVLREEDRKRGSFARVCAYVLANPAKGGLVQESEPWRFSGAVVPGYPTFHPLLADFWVKFWPVYERSKLPDAGNIHRPPIS